MSSPASIHDELRDEFGSLVLGDVDTPALAPESTEDVCRIVAWCRDHAWQVMPVGQGHSFAEDHHVPAGILPVLTSKRKGLSDASPRDLAIEVEPGVPARSVVTVVERAGLRLERWVENYPGTVGGLFCGPRGPELRSLVLGAILVDGTGRMLRFGGAVRKDVSGFDAAGPILGSRGRFAWLDRLVLRLRPAASPGGERASLPPSTHPGMSGRGLYKQVAAAYDPDDVFYKPES